MDFLNDFAKQIQEQASSNKSQLDQYAVRVKEEMEAFRNENKRRTSELEKQFDEYMSKVIEEYKPDPEKIEAFRLEKMEVFNEMLIETDKELQDLLNYIKVTMDPLKTNFEQSLNKVSTFMKETQQTISRAVQENKKEAATLKNKCEKILANNQGTLDMLKSDAEKFANCAIETTQLIAKTVQKKSEELAKKHQKKYDALMKKFDTTFKSK